MPLTLTATLNERHRRDLLRVQLDARAATHLVRQRRDRHEQT
jgi:hypothetical protein